MFRFDSSYKVNINDDLGSATYWNVRFQDIDVRLNAVESYATKITGMADEVSTLGIARINTTLQPYMDSLIANVTTLQTTVTTLQNLVINDQNNVINQLDALLAEATTLVANMEALGTISDGTF